MAGTLLGDKAGPPLVSRQWVFEVAISIDAEKAGFI